jgi:UDP-N-acetylmuramoyl-tripeptide--D-alanyl-D-alanine ligase
MFKSFIKSIILAILTTEAKLVLRKYRPRIVAITGSVGKTSTKDAVYDVAKDSFRTRYRYRRYYQNR